MSSYAVYVGVGLLVSLYLLAKWRRRMFEEQFPPISDAEFLALCSPDTDPKVALKVRRIVADYFAVEYERVYPSTRFIEDLGAD